MRTLMEVRGQGRRAEARRQDPVRLVPEQEHVDGTARPGQGSRAYRAYGFRGGAATHGSMFHRAPGSIGLPAFPRASTRHAVLGPLGGRQSTTKNLVNMRVDLERTCTSPDPFWRSQLDHQDRALESRRRYTRWPRFRLELKKEQWRGRPARRRLRIPVPQAPRGSRSVPRRTARRHAQHEGPLRGLGLGQEALQAEGHRPRPPGRQPSADPPPRRHEPRPEAALVRAGPVGRGEEERVEGRPFAPRGRGADRRRGGGARSHGRGPEGRVGPGIEASPLRRLRDNHTLPRGT